jgi:hypothetical protein
VVWIYLSLCNAAFRIANRHSIVVVVMVKLEVGCFKSGGAKREFCFLMGMHGFRGSTSQYLIAESQGMVVWLRPLPLPTRTFPARITPRSP